MAKILEFLMAPDGELLSLLRARAIVLRAPSMEHGLGLPWPTEKA